MDGMFGDDFALKILDVSSFNTENIKDLSHMFYRCGNLTFINISNFYINNSVDINYIFSGCGNLIFIDISSFDINNYKNIYGDLPKKGKILVSNNSYNWTKKYLPNWEIVIPKY